MISTVVRVISTVVRVISTVVRVISTVVRVISTVVRVISTVVRVISTVVMVISTVVRVISTDTVARVFPRTPRMCVIILLFILISSGTYDLFATPFRGNRFVTVIQVFVRR